MPYYKRRLNYVLLKEFFSKAIGIRDSSYRSPVIIIEVLTQLLKALQIERMFLLLYYKYFICSWLFFHIILIPWTKDVPVLVICAEK